MRRLLCCLSLFLLFTLPLSASACGREAPPPTAVEVLTSMQSAMESTVQPLPDGLTYASSLPAHDPGYLTDTLFSALYGEAARGMLLPDGNGGAPPVNDAALFLSMAPYPCELAVFRCSDTRSAAMVAGLCRGRLDTLSQGYAESEWADVANRGQVSVEGCFVLLAVAENPEAVLEGARGALSGHFRGDS